MFGKGMFKFHLKYLTIEIYWPYIIWNNINYGVKLDTIFLIYKHNPDREWVMIWSVAVKIIGFGIGFAWKHCDNPIMDTGV